MKLPFAFVMPAQCGRVQALLAIVVVMAALTGCRAIGRFGESNQSIAARRLSRSGLRAMRQGEWTDAETLFSEALDVSGRNDAAHRGLAESLWQRNQRDDAIKHMEQAVQLSAGDPKHLQRLGRMYLEVGRIEDAARQCEIALQTDRDWPSVWALWGDCEMAQLRSQKALAAYHRALSLQPDYPYAQLRTAEIYHLEKRYDRLLATLDRVRDDYLATQSTESDGSIQPGRSDLLRGIAMRELGRTDEAVRYLALAAQRNPTDATSRLQLASIAIADGQTESAQAWLEQAMRLDPAAVRSSGWNIDSMFARSIFAGRPDGAGSNGKSNSSELNPGQTPIQLPAIQMAATPEENAAFRQ